MFKWRRRHTSGDGPVYGARGRLLETDRERQAEAIRVALRRAGCREFSEQRGGFVVQQAEEPGDPFLVCCSEDAGLDQRGEERHYQGVLAADYHVMTGIDGVEGGLQVWPSGVRLRVPRQSPRQLVDDWLRSLTITSDKGKTMQERLDLIAEVNQPRTMSVRIRTALPSDDAHALRETLAWYHDIRSRQAGVNLLIDNLLIGWLAEATGEACGAVIQRLALAIEKVLPSE